MWHTYTPDGRSLVIRRIEAGWLATCGPNRVEAATAAEAIRGAVAIPGATDAALEAWIAEHAEGLEIAGGEL